MTTISIAIIRSLYEDTLTMGAREFIREHKALLATMSHTTPFVTAIENPTIKSNIAVKASYSALAVVLHTDLHRMLASSTPIVNVKPVNANDQARTIARAAAASGVQVKVLKPGPMDGEAGMEARKLAKKEKKAAAKGATTTITKGEKGERHAAQSRQEKVQAPRIMMPLPPVKFNRIPDSEFARLRTEFIIAARRIGTFDRLAKVAITAESVVESHFHTLASHPRILPLLTQYRHCQIPAIKLVDAARSVYGADLRGKPIDVVKVPMTARQPGGIATPELRAARNETERFVENMGKLKLDIREPVTYRLAEIMAAEKPMSENKKKTLAKLAKKGLDTLSKSLVGSASDVEAAMGSNAAE